MAVKIYLDTGSSITDELLNKYDLNLIDLFIIDGENSYVEGIDITKSELYHNMRQGKIYKTSSGSYEEYYKKFKSEIKADNEIIYLGLSSGVTGTNDVASMAKQSLLEDYPEAKIFLLDTKNIMSTLTMTAIRLSILRKQEKNVEELYNQAMELSKHMRHIFSVDDMEYLYRGGRVSRTKKVLSGMLNIKPILKVDSKSGKLEPIAKVRGNKNLWKEYMKQMEQESGGEIYQDQTFVIAHADALNEAKDFKRFLTNQGLEDVVITDIGAVIGCHCGPGTMSIYFHDNTDFPEELRHINWK